MLLELLNKSNITPEGRADVLNFSTDANFFLPPCLFIRLLPQHDHRRWKAKAQ